LRVEDVKCIAVIGAGVMGHGIAQVCARSGYTVHLLDVDEQILKKALELIREGPYGLKRMVEKGRLTGEQAEEVMGRIKTTTSYSTAASDADIVIEAAPERPEVKKEIYGRLEPHLPSHAIIASNTSSIMITHLASATGRPDRFVGMHWFNPPAVMRLVEVVRGALTSDETFNVTVEFCRRLGKTPLEAKDGPGFFTTRFFINMLVEAIRLFELGVAGIKEIDEMAKLGLGLPMGPFELMDMVGLDIPLHAAEYLYKVTGEARYAPPVTLRRLVEAGYLGDPETKHGSRGGWYHYYKIPR